MSQPEQKPEDTLSPSPAHASAASRWKRLGTKVALLTGTLCLLALVLEAGTRLLTDTAPPILERDPQVGQRFLCSFEGLVYDDETGRQVPLRFNQDGLRGPDLPKDKPSGVRRIALFGDSMIASVSLDEEKTTAAQLERLLNESASGVRWEVVNCGICGSSTGQEMVLYREVVAQYHPDIVLCAFFVGNDLTDNSSRLSNNPRIYFDLDTSGKLVQMPFSATRRAASAWLNRHSRFYVWQRIALNRSRHQFSGTMGMISPGDWIFCSQESEDIAHAWDLTAAVLKQFRQEVEGRDSLFAVVLLPSAVEVCRDRFREVTERAGDSGPHFQQDYPEDRLGEICRQAGIPFWSLVPDFRQAAPSADSTVEQEQVFIRGVGHLNERGSLVAAKSLHRFLLEGDPQHLSSVPFAQRVR